jgi:hypothetical protein
MAKGYQLIQAQTLTSTAASVTFSNIPQNYTDLKFVMSARANAGGAWHDANLTFNGSGSYSDKFLYGSGGSSASSQDVSALTPRGTNGNSATANTFGNSEIYIPNYTSSAAKGISMDEVTENNAAGNNSALAVITVGLWTGTSAITTLTIAPISGSFVSGSSFMLYGIGGTRATGGTITSDANYTYHTFTSSSTFTTLEKLKGVEALVIAGGGGGKSDGAGGGGAGGVIWATSQSFNAANTYTITVGGGGSGAVMNGAAGTSGSNSQLSSFIAIGGGLSDTAGGSGGGGSGRSNAAGGASTQTTSGTNFIGYGNSGGNARVSVSGATAGGGGGGAGAVGTSAPNTAPGAGGVGTSLFSNWGFATSTGSLVSGTYYYAGGGGGGSDTYSGASGGSGGGGTGGGSSSAGSATANTGGGGGGGSGQSTGTFRNGGSGGSGLVIIRYPSY